MGQGHQVDGKQKTDFSPRSDESEKQRRARFIDTFRQSPVPDADLVYSQLSLYLPRQELARMLALSDIYRQHVIDSNGVLMEFGTCYGRTAALLTNLRGIFEPFNFTRKLVVFDSFAGLTGTTAQDGAKAHEGDYNAGGDYDRHLGEVLAYHESEAPISHIRKHEIVKGDATKSLEEYLARHPETILAMAYFDFDIYAPTKRCLELLKPHLARNSLLVFDQLNCPEFPGETVALAEVFGLGRCTLKRSPLTPWMSYTTCEGIVG